MTTNKNIARRASAWTVLSTVLMMGASISPSWADERGSSGAGNAVPDDRELVSAAVGGKAAAACRGRRECPETPEERMARIRRWCLGASALIDKILEDAAEQANTFGIQAMIERLELGLGDLLDELEGELKGEVAGKAARNDRQDGQELEQADSFLYRAIVRGIAVNEDLHKRLNWLSLPDGHPDRNFKMTGHAHGLEIYFSYLKDVAWAADRDLAGMYDDDECLYGGWRRHSHGQCSPIVFGAARKLVEFARKQLEVPFQPGKLVIVGRRGGAMPTASTFGPSEVFLTLVEHLAAASASELESSPVRDTTVCLSARLSALSDYARGTIGTKAHGRLGRRVRTVFDRGSALVDELVKAQAHIFGGCSHDSNEWGGHDHRNCHPRRYTCGGSSGRYDD